MFRVFICLLWAFALCAVEPVVVLGGGVGSLTSALYLGRAGLSPLVIEGPTPGGLLTQSHSVQNWPGILEVVGMELTDSMREQAEVSGARFLKEEVIGVDFSKKPLQITTRTLDGKRTVHTYEAESCIIAMGTKPNFLGIPGEQKYWGQGVSNCAICDGSLYKGKVVGVVGGGDAAVLEALYLANIAKEVHVFVRKDFLKAGEEARVQKLRETPNVHFHFNTSVVEVKGGQPGVVGVVLQTGVNKSSLPLDGLFLAIGSTPNSAIFQKDLAVDEKGYILLKKDQETSVPGVYAIGDIVDPVYKQAICAAGDGAKAALQAQQYVSDRTHQLATQKRSTAPVALQEVIEIQSFEQFQKELSSSSVPVVVDFYATWCPPCKKIAPIFAASAQALTGKVKFLKVNVDKIAQLSADFQIRAMPTVVLFDLEGQETERKVGFDQIQELLTQLHADHEISS